MFTVKIVKPSGAEELFEAQHFETNGRDILIHTIQGEMLEPRAFRRGGQEFAVEVYKPEAARDEPEVMSEAARVYVMNRHGSTVATYSI